MPEAKDPLGHDPLEALDRDSIWAFDPHDGGSAARGQEPGAADAAAPTSAGGGPPQSIIPGSPSLAVPGASTGSMPPASAPKPVDRPPVPKAAPIPVHHLVTFSLGAELFGIDIKQIQEIIRHQEVCPVPNTPAYMEGLINLRGRILPVISLRRKMGMVPPPETGPPGRESIDRASRGVSGGGMANGDESDDLRNRRIIIVASRGSLIGLLVDSVKEVMHLPLSVVDPPTSVAGPEAMEFIVGVGKLEDSRLLSILDLEKLLADL